MLITIFEAHVHQVTTMYDGINMEGKRMFFVFTRKIYALNALYRAIRLYANQITVSDNKMNIIV